MCRRSGTTFYVNASCCSCAHVRTSRCFGASLAPCHLPRNVTLGDRPCLLAAALACTHSAAVMLQPQMLGRHRHAPCLQPYAAAPVAAAHAAEATPTPPRQHTPQRPACMHAVQLTVSWPDSNRSAATKTVVPECTQHVIQPPSQCCCARV